MPDRQEGLRLLPNQLIDARLDLADWRAPAHETLFDRPGAEAIRLPFPATRQRFRAQLSGGSCRLPLFQVGRL